MLHTETVPSNGIEVEPVNPKPSNVNVPNGLTVLRILGVPVFGWLLLTESGESIEMRLWALLAFVLLMATDKIDGDIARKYNLVTDFGKLADPVADKALTGMAFVGLSIIGVLWWWVTILMLVREWGITFMRAVMVRRGVVMPASKGGKLKTVLQSIAISGYIAPLALWGGAIPTTVLWVTHIVMAAALLVALATGIQYVFEARESARKGTSS